MQFTAQHRVEPQRFRGANLTNFAIDDELSRMKKPPVGIGRCSVGGSILERGTRGHALNDEPQPQLPFEFGLLNLKPAP